MGGALEPVDRDPPAMSAHGTSQPVFLGRARPRSVRTAALLGQTRMLAVAIASAVAVGAITAVNVQAAFTVVLVGFVLALHARSAFASVLALWALWLWVPLLRRLLDLMGGGGAGPDPLSIAPFAATAGLALLELNRTTLSARARLVLVMAAAGFAIGIPMGARDPFPLAFAVFAYGSALLSFVIGYAELRRGARHLSLERALTFSLPLLAAYGIYQYFFPLTPWDELWLNTIQLTSIGAPEDDHIRVFSALNSPGTLGWVLAVALALTLARERLDPFRLLVAVMALVCLALTYVRSGWLALVGAMIVCLVATRGRAAPRVLALAALIVVASLTLGGSGTGGAFVERVNTLGALESDVSAQERLATTTEVFPRAIRTPGGEGLGSVGEARSLSDGQRIYFPDNGYLGLLFQVGPAGWLLVIGALVVGLRHGLGGRSTMALRRRRVPLLAAIVALLLLELASDALFGIAGVMLWYCVGALCGSRDAVQARRREPSDRLPAPQRPLQELREPALVR